MLYDIVWIVLTYVASCLLWLFTYKYLRSGVASYAIVTVLSNIAVLKFCKVFNIFTVPAAVALYSSSYLITDLISETEGKEASHRAVWYGLVCNIFMSVVMLLTVPLVPASWWHYQKIWTRFFVETPRIAVASIVTFIVSQHLDVVLFHKIRDVTRTRFLWLRNNVATIIAQFVDTFMFFHLAFAFTIPEMTLISIVLSNWIIRVMLALQDTGWLYLFLRLARRIVR